MYDDVAILKAYGETTYDKYGNPKREVKETTVYVQPRGVYQAEFYNASQLGLKPSITLGLTNRDDYDGQKVLTFQGRDYRVIRTDWNAQRDSISLICEERANNGEFDSSDESDS